MPKFLEWTVKKRAESLKARLLKKPELLKSPGSLLDNDFLNNLDLFKTPGVLVNPDVVKYPDSMRDYENINDVIRWIFNHHALFFFEWVESTSIMRETMSSLMAFLADKKAVVGSGKTLGKQ